MPSLTSWTAFIPEKGGGFPTPLNLNFVDSYIVQFVGGVFVLFLRIFFLFLLKIDT